MTANDIALATKKATAIKVIAHMASGLSIKDACKLEGIEERTFNRYLARFPELQQEMEEEINAQMSETLTEMITAKKKNSEALINYMTFLRDRLEMGDDKAAALLMKMDNHLNATMKAILPAHRQEEQAPQEDSAARERANVVLASKQGARRVHIERTVETYRVVVGGSEETGSETVIDAETSPVEEPGSAPMLTDGEEG